jgi:WD40 repeat protein
VTPDGQQVVSASDDRTLKVWDLASGAELRTLVGHGNAVGAVAVTSDGRHAVSASRDRTLKVWDLASGELVVALTCDQWMSCIAAASDRVFVAGDSGGTVHVMELHDPQVIAG